eukprot:3157071-Amphidinium_carterae.1
MLFLFRYDAVLMIGTGSYGSVCQAFDNATKEYVAIKRCACTVIMKEGGYLCPMYQHARTKTQRYAENYE